MGRSLKKSVKDCRKKARRFACSVSDFIDVEDVLKCIDKARNPEKYDQRHPTNIVHTPIDWSKNPPNTFLRFTEELLQVIEEDCEEEEKEEKEKTEKTEEDEDTEKDERR